MKTTPHCLSVGQAESVWTILVEYAGASIEDKDSFVRYLTKPIPFGHEYRFMGVLGFGGKLHYSQQRLWVSCYREDDTDERGAVITTVNKKLGEIGVTKR